MQRFIFLTLLSIILLSNNSFAKGNAGTAATYESRYIVDMPNAGMIPSNNYVFYPKFIEDGGLLLNFEVAPFDFLNVGVSYPIFGIIGDDDMYFSKTTPGLILKARIVGETKYFPAIAGGFSSQGHGLYDNDKLRYAQLSPGFFVVLSKSFRWALGEISSHFGVNYCVENKENMGVNIYGGVEQSMGKYFSLVLEVNPNLNDENSNTRFNIGIRAGIFENITVEWQLRELLASDNKPFKEMKRYLNFEIIKRF